MPNPFTKALTNAKNFLTGTSVVDNEANPASALNRVRRKAASQGQPKNFKTFDAAMAKKMLPK